MAKMAEIPVQIVLRPYASSLPLASFAFGTGNVLYSAYALHWIPAADTRLLAYMLLGFVAPLELAPSFMAFLARDGGGATAFAILALHGSSRESVCSEGRHRRTARSPLSSRCVWQ